MAETYFMQSTRTDNIYEVGPVERANYEARGYRDITDEHRARLTAGSSPAGAAHVDDAADTAPTSETAPPAQVDDVAARARNGRRDRRDPTAAEQAPQSSPEQ